MRALSLTQPWASLVAIGAKQWETRSWPTPVRGQVAIHASKSYPRDCRKLEYQEPFLVALKRGLGDRAHSLPTAAIIAVADITDCQPTERFACGVLTLDQKATVRALTDTIVISDEEEAFGDFSARRFAFKCENVVALPTPIPCRGALNFWTVPDDVLAAIWMQITDLQHDEAVRAEARGEVE